jgi:hypothetical protein
MIVQREYWLIVINTQITVTSVKQTYFPTIMNWRPESDNNISQIFHSRSHQRLSVFCQLYPKSEESERTMSIELPPRGSYHYVRTHKWGYTLLSRGLLARWFRTDFFHRWDVMGLRLPISADDLICGRYLVFTYLHRSFDWKYIITCGGIICILWFKLISFIWCVFTRHMHHQGLFLHGN